MCFRQGSSRSRLIGSLELQFGSSLAVVERQREENPDGNADCDAHCQVVHRDADCHADACADCHAEAEEGAAPKLWLRFLVVRRWRGRRLRSRRRRGLASVVAGGARLFYRDGLTTTFTSRPGTWMIRTISLPTRF